MRKTYEDGYEDGYEAGRDDPSDDILAEIAALRDRIAKLEWLREVENADRTMREWHPDKRKKNEGASKRRDNAWGEMWNMRWHAREAVES
ncbi:hypothetical protein DDE01_11580 [Desulfovibrio desulfuricans]|nr:hypothetical protein DDE01_11580 [Desulfovibrio desulfuricans]